jgi:hypothetical protein
VKSHFTQRKPDLQAPKKSPTEFGQDGLEGENPGCHVSRKILKIPTTNEIIHFESYTLIQEHVHD